MGRWIAAKKKAILPFFLLWAFVRIFVIFLVFFPSKLADPLDPEVKVCGHNTWVSLEVQTCALAILVTMKVISLLYDMYMVRKWKGIDKSWMELYALPKGDAVARYHFYLWMRWLNNIFIFLSALNRLSWHIWKKSMPPYINQVLFICIAFGSVGSVLFLLQFAPAIGKYVSATQRMIMSLIRFNLFIFALLFAATFPKFIAVNANGTCLMEYNSLTSSLYTSFLLVVNMVDVRNFEAICQESLWLMHVIYFIFVVVLLLNFLCAIFSDAYTEVAEIVSTIQWICMLTTEDFRIPTFCNPIRNRLKHMYLTFLEGHIYVKDFRSHVIRSDIAEQDVKKSKTHTIL